MKMLSQSAIRLGLRLSCISLMLIAAGCKPISEQRPSDSEKPVNNLPISAKPEPAVLSTSSKSPQFVVMAFDGSRSLPMWQKTLDFSEEMKAKETTVHFTYFLSGVYFLNYRKNTLYTPPHGKPGDSPIGFADSNLDIEKRVAYVNRAITDGHEIGSHANGHFNGSAWSLADWQQEFNSFKNLIFSIAKNNDVSPEDASHYTIHLQSSQLVGFRAPDLGRNPALYKVLKNNGFAYDTSAAAKPDAWPLKMKNGLWEFPLAQIKYASTTSSILSMDYNFYFKQSQAKDVATKSTPQWQQFYNDTYNSYMNYFNSNYNGNRAPVFIGSHFSEWNDGVYWEAMRNMAEEVCSKPEVRCVTFSELMNYLETHPGN